MDSRKMLKLRSLFYLIFRGTGTPSKQKAKGENCKIRKGIFRRGRKKRRGTKIG